MNRETDSGCRLHPHCLTCPFPRCIFELPQQQIARLMRNHPSTVLALQPAPTPTKQAA